MHRHFTVPVVAFALLNACERSAPSSADATQADAGLVSAQRELDRMDQRIPLPLLPMMADHQRHNMRDHLVAVEQIVTAAITDDFAAIEAAATRIGSSDQMRQMCGHMGSGAPGFTEQALAFHQTADTIATAARKRDHAAVLRALSATLQTCTACHATFKQSVVDQAAWTRITATPRPVSHTPERGP